MHNAGRPRRKAPASISAASSPSPGAPDIDTHRTILAFDYGQRRIGVAVGQSITGSASPLGILDNRGDATLDAVLPLIREWRPDALVVGLPLHSDGTRSDMANEAAAFADALATFDLPVVTVDERYSSLEAERVLKANRAAGRKRRIRKQDIDAAAAVVIAERYLADA